MSAKSWAMMKSLGKIRRTILEFAPHLRAKRKMTWKLIDFKIDFSFEVTILEVIYFSHFDIIRRQSATSHREITPTCHSKIFKFKTEKNKKHRILVDKSGLGFCKPLKKMKPSGGPEAVSSDLFHWNELNASDLV